MPDFPADAALAEELSPSEVELLRLRAERYAAKPLVEERGAREAVVFRRSDAEYAVVLEDLRELRPLRRFTKIPGASALVPGVFQHRGEILAVFDVGNLFETRTSQAHAPWVVVVEHGRERRGFAADELVGIDSFHPHSLRPLPITLGERVGCFSGVTPKGALVLDVAKLFQI